MSTLPTISYHGHLDRMLSIVNGDPTPRASTIKWLSNSAWTGGRWLDQKPSHASYPPNIPNDTTQGDRTYQASHARPPAKLRKLIHPEATR